MTTKLAFGLDNPTLQRTLEAFEHDMELLIGRTLDPNDRNAVLALRDSWHKVVESRSGRSAACAAAHRATGRRCRAARAVGSAGTASRRSTWSTATAQQRT